MFYMPSMASNKEQWSVIPGGHEVNKADPMVVLLQLLGRVFGHQPGKSNPVRGWAGGLEMAQSIGEVSAAQTESDLQRVPQSLQRGAYLSGNHKWPRKSLTKAEGTISKVHIGLGIVLLLPKIHN